MQLLTIEELADRLKVSKTFLYHLASSKRIPVVRGLGRCLRFDEDDIRQWLENGGTLSNGLNQAEDNYQ